jgi:hypothetical protein
MESSGSLDIIVDNNNDDNNNDDNNSSTAAMEAFPGDNDIKLGPGSGTNHHPGNIWFRSYVLSYKKLYQEMEKFEKGQLLLTIIDEIHGSGRCFFVRDKLSDKWCVVPKEAKKAGSQGRCIIRHKISNLLNRNRKGGMVGNGGVGKDGCAICANNNRASFGSWPNSDGRYLVFQICSKTNNHPLCQNKPRHIKDMHQQMGSVLEWQGGRVIELINVEIPRHSFLYTCQNLHKVPHGDASLSNKNKLDQRFQGKNIRVIDICDTGKRTPVGSRSSSVLGLNVYYQDSDVMQHLNESVDEKTFQDELFQHLLKKYKPCGGKQSRDSFGVRIDFGLGQGQSTSMMYEDKAGRICEDKDGKPIRFPFCNMTKLFEMDDSLQSKISDLLRFVQKHIPIPEQRGDRSERVRELFRKECLKENRMFIFEYVDIALRRADERLNMHMDHKNDWREGYNYVAVYSYLSADQGHDFRVAIICTFRSSMGSVMDRIKTISRA